LEFPVYPGEKPWVARRRFEEEQARLDQRDERRAAPTAHGTPTASGTASSGPETLTVKLDMRSRMIGSSSGAKRLEELIADGWEIVSERRKGALDWGRKTEFTLRRR